MQDRFKDDIKQCIKQANEVYLVTNATSIGKMANYVHGQLGYPLILLFANDEREISGYFALYYVFADRKSGRLLILKVHLEGGGEVFPSIADQIPAAYWYEREIHDLYGLFPEGHPDPKRMVWHGNWPKSIYPLRKEFDSQSKIPFAREETDFARVEGEGIYEIPVGPVHAGIIEPGHFRFSVSGEPIINLEAQLFYTHKGIEKLAEGVSVEKCLFIAERISGDESFANALCFCQAIENIARVEIPLRAAYTRVVFAELERLICHLGDLAGICQDVGYLFGTYQFRLLRGWGYRLADVLCGMRFLRSVTLAGGIRKDFLKGKTELILEWLQKIGDELADTVKIVRARSLLIDRIEHTGVVSKKIATDLNAVGPAGRAAGVRWDVRTSFPYAAYNRLGVNVSAHNNGDVNCRMNVKIEECVEAVRLMRQAVTGLPVGEIFTPIPPLEPYSHGFGICEASRGETVHWIMMGEGNTVFRYKIRTPSFCNWPVVCHAVQGNIVPDFPLINKSFNLSYAGNDL